jgi:xanthine dehydrogenase accessory factor
MAALASGQAKPLRYGIGSPFFDLKLPCGGGLSILLIPNPDRAVLRQVLDLGTERKSAFLSIGLTDGSLALASAPQPDRLVVEMAPELRFWVYGHGIEAIAFASMTHAAGYDVTLFGQNSLQTDITRLGSLPVETVASFRSYVCPLPDEHTAITLFFHDHENEARILAQFLPTDAFYIGAQGSLRARMQLVAELKTQGVAPEHLARLRPDFGLIPSCRDPRTLAVSVMAHVLSVHGV